MLAGVADPLAWTLRELAIMSHARREEEWRHTARLCLHIRQAAGDGKSRESDFHPYGKAPYRAAAPVNQGWPLKDFVEAQLKAQKGGS